MLPPPTTAAAANHAVAAKDSTGQWSNYQRQIYGSGIPPPFTTQIHVLEPLAKAALDRDAYWYIAGSAGTGETCNTNTEAFKQWRLIPRMLVDANKRDLRTTLFGTQYSSPVLFAPVGVNGLWHTDGEEAVARAAAKIGVPWCMSTAATRSIECLAEANGPNGQRWYQLYWPQSNDITVSLLNRAKKNGFTTLIVTLDTTLLGHRPNDLDEAVLPFLQGIGCAVGFSDPVYCKKMGAEPKENMEGLKPADKSRMAMGWLGEVNGGVFRTWKDLAFLQANWDGPIVLKGIQSVADAHLALSHGLSGIIVSNHGGRQLDGAISSLSALARITADPLIASHPEFEILFDSGIRSGTDVIKALCLGAKAVLIGRPWIYGLAIGGQEGVEHVMKTLLCEVETSLALMGCPNVGDLGREWLEKV